MSNVNNVPSLSGSSADNPSENWIKKTKTIIDKHHLRLKTKHNTAKICHVEHYELQSNTWALSQT